MPLNLPFDERKYVGHGFIELEEFQLAKTINN
jgi:hypothetical protein